MTVTPDVRVGLISETCCLPIIVAFGTQMKFMYFIFFYFFFFFLLKIISESHCQVFLRKILFCYLLKILMKNEPQHFENLDSVALRLSQTS